MSDVLYTTKITRTVTVCKDEISSRPSSGSRPNGLPVRGCLDYAGQEICKWGSERSPDAVNSSPHLAGSGNGTTTTTTITTITTTPPDAAKNTEKNWRRNSKSAPGTRALEGRFIKYGSLKQLNS
ncbi:hypothetical protein E2C01_012764 [Portunus trituberculatus]|uniref:Uncharacterized protein n=1 Tax=Portunus trituberculatus TaxID=210409 RepID=A0A5B7DF02_PORTR|nr:hypothetical protein [Portunus trituberculatus]